MNKETIEEYATVFADTVWVTENARFISNHSFIKGAEWFMNYVWHDAKKERPDMDKHYLAVLEFPNITEYYVWRGYANHPFWTKWAYIEDLLPNYKL